MKFIFCSFEAYFKFNALEYSDVACRPTNINLNISTGIWIFFKYYKCRPLRSLALEALFSIQKFKHV